LHTKATEMAKKADIEDRKAEKSLWESGALFMHYRAA